MNDHPKSVTRSRHPVASAGEQRIHGPVACITPHARLRFVWTVLLLTPLVQGHSAKALAFTDAILLESPNAQVEGLFGAEGVGSVPDVNGDGIADILVPALCDSPDGSPSCAGRVYLFDGKTREFLREFKSPNEVENSSFGSKIVGIDDLNGNGCGEVIVATGNKERLVYILDGSTGELIHTLSIRGKSLSAVPDVNEDGLPDIVVGTAGAAMVYDGASGSLRNIRYSLPAGASALFGWSVSGIPDANGNGGGDIVVGDWAASEAGAVYTYDGTTGELLHSLLGNDQAGADDFGRSVAGLRDVNGDGRGDLLIGASGGVGHAYIFDGDTGLLLHGLYPPEADNVIGFGWVVEALPDVTGDGINDAIVMGNPAIDLIAGTHNAYVFDGATGTHLATLPGNKDYGGGNSIAGLPDVNGDGLGEVLVANFAAPSTSGFNQAGHVLLYLSVAGDHVLSIGEISIDHQSLSVSLSWGSTTQKVYRVEVSTNLLMWTELPDFVDAQGSETTYSGSQISSETPRRFYRIKED